MFRITFLAVSLLLLTGCRSVFESHQYNPDGDPYVRVCLADALQEAEIVLEPGAVLQAVGHRYTLDGNSTMLCRQGAGGAMDVLVDGKPARTISGAFRVYSRRPDARFGFDGRLYSDTLLFASDGRGIYVVNLLPVEEYLRGVVPELIGRNRKNNEIAAVRAQAIIARTYVRRKIDLPLRRLFDVYNDGRDLPYGGLTARDAVTDAAVEQTRGEVLTFEDMYAETYSHSCCGGRTESAATGQERQSSPRYLSGVRDQGRDGDWCRVSPSYRWRVEYTRTAFERMLRRTLPAVDERFAADGVPEDDWYLLDVKVRKRTRSGRVDELVLIVGNASRQQAISLGGNDIRRVLEREEGRPLKSTMIDIFLERDDTRWIRTVRIDGGGMGQGVGFCQWGAIARARAGYSADAILNAYFPGISVDSDY